MKTKDILPETVLSRKDEITADFIAMAENHLADMSAGKATKRLHASDFGAKLFIHPRHLTTTLKLTINSSVCDYMEARMIEETNKLLLETNLPIAEISQRFGYTEATNFTKFYRGMTDTTPLRYRKSQRGD